jgi:hypothetical protein
VNELQNQPSSATEIARDIMLRWGIPRDAIRGDHVAQRINALNRVFPIAGDAVLSNVFCQLSIDVKTGPEPLWGVIIETRCHPALKTVVLNIASCCDIPIQLFHSPDNTDFILSSDISRLVDNGQVILTALNLPGTIGQSIYNKLMLSVRFWEKMKGRGKILVFQTDSMCCPGSEFCAADFMSFDYIGSYWGRGRPVGLIIDGGSGGFSLRDWSESATCLERFPSDNWPGGEDGYFGFHLELMGAKVASISDAGAFSTQDSFESKSFGCHQIDRLNDIDLVAFLAYCPEARGIFPHLEQRAPLSNSQRALLSAPSATIDDAQPHALAHYEFSSANLTEPGKPMFLSENYKLIYYEVPRTGSNSITQALATLDPESPTLAERKRHGGGWGYHYLRDEALKDPAYRLIAAHRNPYDRLWSFWKHRKLNGNPKIFTTVSWARYIDWVCDPSSAPELEETLPDVPISEMLDYSRVDFWLDFHHLQASWARLAQAMDIPVVPLKKVNASPNHGQMHMAYTEAMAERIAERFAQDFMNFGYSPDSWKPGKPIQSSNN